MTRLTNSIEHRKCKRPRVRLSDTEKITEALNVVERLYNMSPAVFKKTMQLAAKDPR